MRFGMSEAAGDARATDFGRPSCRFESPCVSGGMGYVVPFESHGWFALILEDHCSDSLATLMSF